MARQSVPIQVNQFVGGLNTEANPLNYPTNSSYDEVNMELESNGSRFQRPGFDVEENYLHRFTGVARQSDVYMGRSQFRWDNPSGFEGDQIIVVQIGNFLAFHKSSTGALSTNRIHYEIYSSATYSKNFTFAQVDGYLVVANGLPGISIYEYDGNNGITRANRNLLIRDFFGVEALGDGKTVTDPTNWQYRPEEINRFAVYNLRNQTFALPQVEYEINTLDKKDPLERFRDASGDTVWPSHSDSIIPHLWANTSLTTSRTVERYQAADHFAKVPQNERAPMGYFIIDALRRGTSRQAALNKLENDYPELTVYGGRSTTFPADTTPGGATQVTNYAGRVWYAGFSSTILDGDSESPRLGSYLLFSQIVENIEDINRCYQASDPTNPEDAEIAADDGGYIKIAGAYNINKLVVMDSSLYVFAENGVWRVRGTEEDVFTATGYSVSKLSEFGCTSGGSVVQYGNEVLFWSDDGIYRLFQDPTLNTFEVKNITGESIETLYNQITSEERLSCIGFYDERTTGIRWLYGGNAFDKVGVNELVLNVKYGVFTKNFIDCQNEVHGPISVCGGTGILSGEDATVTANSATVTANSVTVTVPNLNPVVSPSESFYCILTEYNGSELSYTFGGYREGDTYYDWERLTGTAYWPEAYIVTGPINTGEGRLRKDSYYLTVHMPYEATGVSCRYSARWGWSNDVNSGRWSSMREAYRTNSHSQYLDIVSTRNKIRGSGRAVAFKFDTNEEKPLKLYGWEFTLNAKDKE